MLRRALLLAIALVALVPAAANAQDTVIPFTGLADGTPIGDQYTAQGVSFGNGLAFGFGEISQGCTPSAPVARGGAAELGRCGGASEFPRYGSMGAFSSFRSAVSMRVSSGTGSDVAGEDVRLRVYDVRRNLITSADVPVTAAGRTLGVTLGTPQIAFFSLERLGINLSSPRIDDFTYDNPPVPPDPQIALGVDANAALRLRQGGTVDVPIRILRFNGSNGNVALGVAGLPPDAGAATFLPDPVGGSAFVTPATLRLSAPTTAALGRSTPTITANPVSSAGSQSDSATFALDIVPPFRLELLGTSAQIAPCTPATVPLTFAVEPGFSDPITLSVATASNRVTARLPGTFTPGFSPEIKELALETVAGGGAGADQLQVTARSGTFVATDTVAVQRVAGSIDNIKLAIVADVDAGLVQAPKLGQPGTLLRVLGSGLCPDARILFGPGDGQGAPVESPSADGRLGLVRVPATATTGAPSLVNSDSDGRSAGAPQLGRALTVQTYRNTRGFSFQNFTSSGPSWGDIVDFYGTDDTTIVIDPCGDLTFGLADCGVSTHIPRPEVFLYWRNVSDYGEGGNCYGMALGSYRLSSGRASRAPFSPPGALFPFALDAPTGPAPDLRAYVRKMQLVQSASEVLRLRAASVSRQNAGSMFQVIQALLQQGRPAIMSVRSGSSGHALLAYGLTPTPTGYDIEVYDSNTPHTAAEDATAATHTAALTSSKINVNVNGTWTFPALNWSGDFTAIGAYDVEAIPDDLRPPTGLDDYLVAITHPDASTIAAVTDAAGRPIDRPARLPAETGDAPGPTVDLIPAGLAFQARLAGSGGIVSLLGSGGRAFALEGTATALDLDRAGRVLGVQDAARGVRLTATSGDAPARAATASFSAAGDVALGFPSAGTLTVRAGAAATVTLELGQVARRATGALTLRGLRLRAGETARLQPASWSRPGRVTVSIRRGGGAARTVVLRTRVARDAAAVRGLSLRARGATVTATARLRLPAGSAATATLRWVARKGSRTVRRGAIVLSEAQLADLAAGRGLDFTVQAPNGRLRVRASLVLAAAGPRSVVPTLSAKQRTVRVRVG